MGEVASWNSSLNVTILVNQLKKYLCDVCVMLDLQIHLAGNTSETSPRKVRWTIILTRQFDRQDLPYDF